MHHNRERIESLADLLKLVLLFTDLEWTPGIPDIHDPIGELFETQ